MAKRFAGLTFCWADMVFELDANNEIVFAAGATRHLLGAGQRDLLGRSFLPLIDERDRRGIAEYLDIAAAGGRIDEHGVRMHFATGTVSEVAIAGYRAEDFDNHFFLAVKVAPRRAAPLRRRDGDRDEATGVMNEESFAAVATERIKSYQQAGGKPKVSLIKIDNMEELQKNLHDRNPKLP